MTRRPGPAARAVRAAYGVVFRTVLRRLDPERAHHLAMDAIRLLGVSPTFARAVRRRTARGEPVTVMGLPFPNRFGLAAGFDKNAVGLRGLGALGFGHVEIGTVTARPQPGNPRPRLFRLVQDRALLNRMGFNNDGAEAVAARLATLRREGALPVVGVNIGKSRVVAVEDAIDDYRVSARLLAPVADYLVVNVSSPNTPGLRGLQELDRLEPLLAAVAEEAGAVPLLVKIAPDLDDEAIGHIAALTDRLGLAGVVATNTSTGRAGLRTPADLVGRMGDGGLSGAPIADRSLAVLRVLRAALSADRVVISVGGVETAAHVRERLAAGADLVQGYTGFLYAGPGWAAELARA
ncbi:quinone-dependent dihydroorotate dehydrogenase [Amnibacterium sp. CER49]|uniref:quinone-dependent dihydroorotate dehydrogenase n=1 Tax=Amnibacterium sp. CER49 TaxID=3039161 RepID=UPI002446DC56|nr:quinone-dependent dihydroorotate dehydrogenase [Amnibacterium sp. CER49]MDH2444691.1 quinone-dependent dihydroorotate dehydrogenase [Amnibacterium sp. CER49]